MSFPLENARLCLDCDTVFDAPLCPSCSSESYFPLSRWIRPALDESQRKSPAGAMSPAITKTARNASLVLAGSGVAYALWKLFGSERPHRQDQESEPAPRKKQKSRGNSGKT